MSFAAETRNNLAKDLRLEGRSKDALNAVGFFSLLVVVIFAFSFEPTAEESRLIAGGIIWVGLLFATVVALNQAWSRELRNQVLDAYRLSPASPAALFLGKALANFLFVCAVESFLAPVFIVFYNLRAVGTAPMIVLLFVLGTWALVVNGTFFAAVSLRTRNREMMLPLLLFPISIPALLATVECSTALLAGEGPAGMWLKLLGGYDVVFTTVALLLFATILEAE